MASFIAVEPGRPAMPMMSSCYGWSFGGPYPGGEEEEGAAERMNMHGASIADCAEDEADFEAVVVVVVAAAAAAVSWPSMDVCFCPLYAHLNM